MNLTDLLAELFASGRIAGAAGTKHEPEPQPGDETREPKPSLITVQVTRLDGSAFSVVRAGGVWTVDGAETPEADLIAAVRRAVGA